MSLGLLLWFLAGVWGPIVANDKKPFASGAERLGWIVLGPYSLIAAYLFRKSVCHRCGRTLLANEDYYCRECHQVSLRELRELAVEDTDFEDEDDQWDQEDNVDSEDERDHRE